MARGWRSAGFPQRTGRLLAVRLGRTNRGARMRGEKLGQNPDHFRFGRALSLIRNHVAISDLSPWLDIGCNDGAFLRQLIGRWPSTDARGIDVWDPKLKSETDRAWRYSQADVSQQWPDLPPLRIISAFEVLEHIVDTDRFLAEIRERLAPGGWLLLSTPNINSLRNRVLVPFGVYPAGLEYRTVIHHVRLYNVATLRHHLTESGFDVVAMRGVSFLPMRAGGFSALSRSLANALPQLCGNLLVLAQRSTVKQIRTLTIAGFVRPVLRPASAARRK